MSKVYEILIYKQVLISNSYFQNINVVSERVTDTKLFTGNGGEMEEVFDKRGTRGTLLGDLSKAFDCLPHNLLLAKLSAYGFDESSLEYMKNNLIYQKQRVKSNSSFSNWTNILYVVP